MSAPTNVLHLRAETKPLEHRSALTPSTTKALIEAGYTVYVERDPQRIFDDEEFEAVGAKLVPTGSWVDAPKEHIIVGLKELEEKDCESLVISRYTDHEADYSQFLSSILMCNCM
jgi:saccharopine dehydrogenase (NAD+, L-lysine-forming)